MICLCSKHRTRARKKTVRIVPAGLYCSENGLSWASTRNKSPPNAPPPADGPSLTLHESNKQNTPCATPPHCGCASRSATDLSCLVKLCFKWMAFKTTIRPVDVNCRTGSPRPVISCYKVPPNVGCSIISPRTMDPLVWESGQLREHEILVQQQQGSVAASGFRFLFLFRHARDWCPVVEFRIVCESKATVVSLRTRHNCAELCGRHCDGNNKDIMCIRWNGQSGIQKSRWPIHTCVDFSRGEKNFSQISRKCEHTRGFLEKIPFKSYSFLCRSHSGKVGIPAGLDFLAARKMPASVNRAFMCLVIMSKAPVLKSVFPETFVWVLQGGIGQIGTTLVHRACHRSVRTHNRNDLAASPVNFYTRESNLKWDERVVCAHHTHFQSCKTQETETFCSSYVRMLCRRNRKNEGRKETKRYLELLTSSFQVSVFTGYIFPVHSAVSLWVHKKLSAISWRQHNSPASLVTGLWNVSRCHLRPSLFWAVANTQVKLRL